ncbi:hypothetical protein REPUB_Repub06bG0137200 [Reevesia pubescens]
MQKNIAFGMHASTPVAANGSLTLEKASDKTIGLWEIKDSIEETKVNKKYRCLEIDLDGLYKRILLLKKKKHATVKVQFKDGMPYELIERKGLDMVRRDWSLLSKELGDLCLGQILS